jgi:AAA+ ATPase superfamily predicted ATPase
LPGPEELRKSLNDFVSWDKRILKYLRRIRSLRIHEVEVKFSLGKERPSFSSILEALEDWAEDEGKRIVMIIDEAQEFIRMKGYSILPLIAYAYDNLKHISFVFAGSKIGLLYRFLRVNDPESPLYGRYIERIELTPLNRE